VEIKVSLNYRNVFKENHIGSIWYSRGKFIRHHLSLKILSNQKRDIRVATTLGKTKLSEVLRREEKKQDGEYIKVILSVSR